MPRGTKKRRTREKTDAPPFFIVNNTPYRCTAGEKWRITPRTGVLQERGGDYSSSNRIFIISTAALATEVPGPKIAATPAL